MSDIKKLLEDFSRIESSTKNAEIINEFGFLSKLQKSLEKRSPYKPPQTQDPTAWEPTDAQKAWLTKGGGSPDVYDPAIIARMPSSFGEKPPLNYYKPEDQKYAQQTAFIPQAIKNAFTPVDLNAPVTSADRAALERINRQTPAVGSTSTVSGMEPSLEENGLQAYLGNKKYGNAGMAALRKAGREGASKEKMAKIRAKYDKLDEQGVAEVTGDSKFDTMMSKISQPAMQKAEQDRKLSTIQSVADALCNDLKCDYDDLTDQDLEFIAGEAGASMYEVMSALGRQKFNAKRNIGKWDDEDINEQGVAEANVSKYKDLGATNATTHFLKNVTTGKIISPHRSRADADEALQAATNTNKEGHKFTIVRARKQGKSVEGMKYVLVDYRGNYFKGMDKFGRNLSTRNPEEAEIFNLERDAKDIALWTRNRFKAIPWSGQQGVAEGLPGSLSASDYMPGATLPHTNWNCIKCSGHKFMYSLDGKLTKDNKKGAIRVKCPDCGGSGLKKPDPGHDYFGRKKEEGVAEGYSLKKTNVEKTFHPGDPEDFGSVDMTRKDTDYEIINNKTGQVVGTASWTTNDYFGPGAIKITMKNGATRYLDIKNSDKGNPQSAFNRFVKDPSTSKKYKEQGVAEGSSNKAANRLARKFEIYLENRIESIESKYIPKKKKFRINEQPSYPNAQDPNAQTTTPKTGSEQPSADDRAKKQEQQIDIATAKSTMTGLKNVLGPNIDINQAASAVTKINDKKPLTAPEQQAMSAITPLLAKAAEMPQTASGLKTSLTNAAYLTRLGK